MPDSIYGGNRPTGPVTDYGDIQGDPLAQIKAKLAARAKGIAADPGSAQPGRVAKGGSGPGGDTYSLDAPSSQPSAQQYQDSAMAMSRFTSADTEAVDLFDCMAVLYDSQQETRKIDREVADAETALQVAKIADEAKQLKNQAGAALGGAIAMGVMDFVSAGLTVAGAFSAAGAEEGAVEGGEEGLGGELDESPTAEEPDEIELQPRARQDAGDEEDIEDEQQDQSVAQKFEKVVDEVEDVVDDVKELEEDVDKISDDVKSLKKDVSGNEDDTQDSGDSKTDEDTAPKPERTSLEMRQKIIMNKWQAGAEVAKNLGNIGKAVADYVSMEDYQSQQTEDKKVEAQAQSDHNKYYDDSQNALSNMRDVQNMLEKIATTMHSWPAGTV